MSVRLQQLIYQVSDELTLYNSRYTMWKLHTDLISSDTVPCFFWWGGVCVMDQIGTFLDVETPRSAELRSSLSNPQVREVLSRKMFVNTMPSELKSEKPNGTILQGKVWVRGQPGQRGHCFQPPGEYIWNVPKRCLPPAFIPPPALWPALAEGQAVTPLMENCYFFPF